MFHSRGAPRRTAPVRSGPSLSSMYLAACAIVAVVVLAVGVAVPYALVKRQLRDALESEVRESAELAASVLRAQHSAMEREASRALEALDQPDGQARRLWLAAAGPEPRDARADGDDKGATRDDLAEAARSLGVTVTAWRWEPADEALRCIAACPGPRDVDAAAATLEITLPASDVPGIPSGETSIAQLATADGLRVDALLPVRADNGELLGAIGAASVRGSEHDLAELAAVLERPGPSGYPTLALDASATPLTTMPAVSQSANATTAMPSHEQRAEMVRMSAGGSTTYQVGTASDGGAPDTVLAYVEPCEAWDLHIVGQGSLTEALAPARQAAWTAGLALLLAMALLALFGAFVGQRALIGPLETLRRAVGQPAAGTRRPRRAAHAPREIGLLADAVENALHTATDEGGAARESSGAACGEASSLSSFARRISAQMGELAGALARTSQRAAVIESASERIAEACSQARATVTDAEAVARAIGSEDVPEESPPNATRAVAQSAETLDQVLQAAMEVNLHAQAVDSQFRGQTGRSERIAELVEQISRIARKTDLLAIAAGIEAVNAGPAGTGFRTVADEIRSLAVDTGRSASAIREQAGALRNGADLTEEKVGALLRAAGDASQNVGAAREALSAIVRETERLRAMAAGSAEQTASQRAIAADLQARLRVLREALEEAGPRVQAQVADGAEIGRALRSAVTEVEHARDASSHAETTAERLCGRLREGLPPEGV